MKHESASVPASLRALALSLGCLLAAPAIAKLPPPTPEQQQAAEARKAKEAQDAKAQADALAKVQDQIAARFGKGSDAAAKPAEAQAR
ncbi:hypothetical protein SGO26_24380 [Cupriavidus metallidurans]|uniref:hypothetical protein n=1 Tax=Cupriavidus TaxID=106589 RepID=UPI0002A3C99A|nr:MULTISPECIES: hypothetical protein [Cupriavidus]EKZ96244.1 hypothetical protein D769_26107 [Cupriavidus sp. HMR-1]GMG94046.1 hypothetical protein Cmtc_52660 [Cupriavidus sp. TKC]